MSGLDYTMIWYGQSAGTKRGGSTTHEKTQHQPKRSQNALRAQNLLLHLSELAPSLVESAENALNRAEFCQHQSMRAQTRQS